MPASERIYKRASQIMLDNGTDSEGKQQTVNISLAGLSVSGWDVDKYVTIVNALEPCLSKTVYSKNVITSSVITDA